MLRKLSLAALAALSLGGASLATTSPAQAYWVGGYYGPGWGLRVHSGWGWGGYRPYYPAYSYGYAAPPRCVSRPVDVWGPYGWHREWRRSCW